jgi:hypothetical protein
MGKPKYTGRGLRQTRREPPLAPHRWGLAASAGVKVSGVTISWLAPGACCCARGSGFNGKPVGEGPQRVSTRAGLSRFRRCPRNGQRGARDNAATGPLRAWEGVMRFGVPPGEPGTREPGYRPDARVADVAEGGVWREACRAAGAERVRAPARPAFATSARCPPGPHGVCGWSVSRCMSLARTPSYPVLGLPFLLGLLSLQRACSPQDLRVRCATFGSRPWVLPSAVLQALEALHMRSPRPLRTARTCAWSSLAAAGP